MSTDENTPLKDEVTIALEAQGERGRNRRVLGSLTVMALAMLCLGFASKPLYDAFCRVTGYGGTVRIAEENNNNVYDRVIRVEFDANTAKELGWDFGPEVRFVDVKVGDNNLMFYNATNLLSVPTTATSNFNVTPTKAAPYFSKLECFCFTEQTLGAGESTDFPVVFFLDPLLLEDDRMDDITKVTLSYTFFPVEKGEALKEYIRPDVPAEIDAERAKKRAQGTSLDTPKGLAGARASNEALD